MQSRYSLTVNSESVNMLITFAIPARVVSGVTQLNIYYVQAMNWRVENEARFKLIKDDPVAIDMRVY